MNRHHPQKPWDLLAEAAHRGDPDALDQLYERLGPPLLGFLTLLLDDRSQAEDVLHDTFVRLFEGRGNPPGGKTIKAWLFTVARRLALDRMRAGRRHRQLAGPGEARAIMGSCGAPDSEVNAAELDHLVQRILAELPAAYATTFNLRIVQEFTYPEIAAICQEPQGTLRSRVHHTLELLRQAITRETSKGLTHE